MTQKSSTIDRRVHKEKQNFFFFSLPPVLCRDSHFFLHPFILRNFKACRKVTSIIHQTLHAFDLDFTLIVSTLSRVLAPSLWLFVSVFLCKFFLNHVRVSSRCHDILPLSTAAMYVVKTEIFSV